MSKLILIIFAIVVLYFGYQQYQQKKTAGELGVLSAVPSVSTDSNSEVLNTGNVNIHCVGPEILNGITNLNFSLANEVYTPAIKQLRCSYENLGLVDNVTPTITYKINITNDANGTWIRKQDSLKSQSTYAESADYPNTFAILNPVLEVNQGDFYGHKDTHYVELNYTPVAEGQSTLFNRGMQIMEKVLNN